MYSFPIWNQSIVPCPVLTLASWPAYRFVRKQVRWSDIPVSKNFPVCCDPHSQHSIRSYKLKAESHKATHLPHPLQEPTASSGYLCSWSISYKPRLPPLSPWVWLICWNSLQNSRKQFSSYLPGYYKGYDKEHRWTSRWKKCIVRDTWEWGWVWTFLAVSLGSTVSQHVHMVTIVEALQIPYCWDFYGDFREAW